MIKKLVAFLISAAMIASLVACSQSSAEVNKEKKETKTTENKTVESDKKPAKVDTLVIAYLPNESKEDLSESRKGAAADMEKALGVKVKEFLASDYNATIEAMRTGKADLAFFGPLSYSQAHERAKAEPLVAPAQDRDKSKAGYYSYLITSAKNDKIKSIADLKGKKFAFVDANSTSGNLVPSYEILKAIKDDKLTFEDLHTNGKFFESVSFSGAHQNGLQAVLKGDIDAAPCASDIFQRELNAKKFNESDIKIIHKSPMIPQSPIAIRSDLPEELKKAVKDFYLKYDNDDYFKKFIGQKDGQKLRFIEVNDDFYKEIHDLRKKFGL
ncbi:MAG: phosphate/phosphite/phosphonate ABC transporter substrate-binding protein [Clostridia bacterium]|nr:phosphate/phosphite/phosphonate ABC transporter substrate-binding protein [Clostridia bacterium]